MLFRTAQKRGPVQHSWSSTRLISLDPNSVHRIYIPMQSEIACHWHTMSLLAADRCTKCCLPIPRIFWSCSHILRPWCRIGRYSSTSCSSADLTFCRHWRIENGRCEHETAWRKAISKTHEARCGVETLRQRCWSNQRQLTANTPTSLLLL